jgi:hypothetical protein
MEFLLSADSSNNCKAFFKVEYDMFDTRDHVNTTIEYEENIVYLTQIIK